jgi:anti-sigma regulatory factor (Ser/Thr protein kinase)
MEDLIERDRPPAGAVPVLACDFDRAALPAVRRAVADRARASGLDDLATAKFVLAVSEVADNAVRHGGGRGRLRLWHGADGLCCRVADRGPGIPARYRDCRRHPRPGDPLGSTTGLWLVRQICARVQIGTGPDGGAVVLLCYCPEVPPWSGSGSTGGGTSGVV